MAVKFNGESFPLKYLFVAVFEDGTVIEQTPEDISKLNPEKSEFYDVLEKQKQIPLRLFSLLGEGHTYLVNLTDGTFQVDNVPAFKLHEEDVEEFRLIYFRRHRHGMTSEEFTSHEVEYHIGWQTTLNGKNYQHKITIN